MSDHKKSVISFFWQGGGKDYVATILYTFSAFFKCLCFSRTSQMQMGIMKIVKGHFYSDYFITASKNREEATTVMVLVSPEGSYTKTRSGKYP